MIGAADCIVRMKETAFSVQDNIARMRSSCDIHSLKRNVAAKTKKAQSGSMGMYKRRCSDGLLFVGLEDVDGRKIASWR